MKQQALAFFTDTNLTLLGLGLFLFVFIGVSFIAFFKSQDTVDQLSALPLVDGETHGQQ